MRKIALALLSCFRNKSTVPLLSFILVQHMGQTKGLWHHSSSAPRKKSRQDWFLSGNYAQLNFAFRRSNVAKNWSIAEKTRKLVFSRDFFHASGVPTDNSENAAKNISGTFVSSLGSEIGSRFHFSGLIMQVFRGVFFLSFFLASYFAR